MGDYYARRLSGERLRRCYEVAPPRVRRYLEAEIEFVLARVRETDLVLELGCGYGRVLEPLLRRARQVVGIDNAFDSLSLARRTLGGPPRLLLAQMDAVALGLHDRVFDLVVCVQNGICAFRVDPRALIAEALRVTRRGGRLLVSGYAPRFWPHRLEWFEIQAAHGLVGEIDREATRDGVITCKDGFRSGTVDEGDWARLLEGRPEAWSLTEVDASSLFCEIEAR